MPLQNYSEMKMSSEKGDIWDMTIRPLSLKDKKAYGLKIDVDVFKPIFKKHSTLLIDEEAKISHRDLVVVQLENAHSIYVLIGEHLEVIEDKLEGRWKLITTRLEGKIEEYHFIDKCLVSDSTYDGTDEEYLQSMEDFGQFKVICKHKIVASRFQ